MLTFATVRQGETIELPGRADNKADRWKVLKKIMLPPPGHGRITVESLLRPGMQKVMTDNQFDDMGFVEIGGEMPVEGRSPSARKLVRDSQALRNDR